MDLGLASGIRFADEAAARGLSYRWPQQPRPLRNIEAFGCGCAFLDYDDDGWMDILLVASPHPVLYHNRGDGSFEDATSGSGLDKLEGRWTGVAVGDYDDCGRLDLLLTGYHCLALMKNLDGRRFADRTRDAGLDPHNRGHWGSSAAFMDLDGSGKLALIIGNYVVMGPHEPQYCELVPGVRSGCPPATYRPEYAELWQNEGHGRFHDVSAQAGFRSCHGKALVVAFADVDGHGHMDFYMGNDGTPAELMRNQSTPGVLRFENLGFRSGVGGSATLRPIAAMGADWADYNGDGRPDLAVSAFSNESYMLMRNEGGYVFQHTEDRCGIAGVTLKMLGFGTKWLDMDNDGWPDLSFANGHVYDNTAAIDPLTSFREPLMLFHNEPGAAPGQRTFRDIVPLLGGAIARPVLGRGSAVGDFDNDGREDLLAVDYEGTPVLLHNLSAAGKHWVTFDLRTKGPNRFAYGATITAAAGSRRWVASVAPASSYLSSSDPRIHFGLGTNAKLDTVRVRWPDGGSDTYRDVGCDHMFRIVKGAGIAEESAVRRSAR